MSAVGQVVLGGTSTGSTTAATIILNMWLKHHGHDALQPEEAAAIIGVVTPVIHIATLVGIALLGKILGWIKLEVPGLQSAIASVPPDEFQGALNAMRAEMNQRIRDLAATPAATIKPPAPPAPATLNPAPAAAPAAPVVKT